LATDQGWNLTLLTAHESGRRNRRTVDAVLLVPVAIVTALAAVVAASAEGIDADVGDAIVTVLGWAGGFWRTAFVAVLLVALLIIVDVLVHRRWALARDLVVAVVIVFAAATVLGGVADSDWFPIELHVLSKWAFPEPRIACAAAVVAVAAPELIRPVRLVAGWLVVVAALGAVAIEAALPSSVLGALALGLGVGALVRLAFGTAAGVPPAEQVRQALTELGVEIRELQVTPRQQMGAAEYVGHEVDGEPVKVRVLGRDAQDTQRLARHWRALAYRDPPRSVAVGRLEQVEHEALATLMAAQAGVRAPMVVTAALDADGDALVVTRQPNVVPLEETPPEHVADELLRGLWAQVARLHAAGISHGRLNGSNVLVVDGAPLLIGLSAATLGAPRSALDIDVAELLVACAVLVGSDRALSAALDGVGKEAVSGAVPYLQRAALTPHVRDLARTHEVALKELRGAAAAATGTESTEVAPLRRVRLKDLVLTVLLGVAAYLLITQLAEIGFDTIADEFRRAELAWVAVALILAQLTFVASGISVRGAVAAPLPLLPCVVLQSAIKFINLTVPSSAGRIAMNLRFLQRMGVPTGQAAVAGAVDDASETIVQLALFLLTLPFIDVALNTGDIKIGTPDSGLVAAILIVLVAGVAVILAVPSLRAKVVPAVKDAFAGLWTVIRVRRKRLELFGGNVASEALYALALGAACLAYGVDLSLAELVFVNTSASVLSSLIPSPGGIGAAEASLTAGLIAVGVDDSTAFAIALTLRFCTFYLPPIWGYFSLKWLKDKGYV
jgi:uncharacterized membrane protein YbhN (UPF0104 family)/tRNA A-37 threonylcarbamoyl transferase component Bud32